jgi:signal peptidase I
MLNVDSPGFPFALLAIIASLRLIMYFYHRLTVQAPEPVTAALTPDETVEPAVISLPEGLAATVVAAAKTPAQPAEAGSSASRFVAELLDSGIIAVILVFFIIRPFVLQAFFIPTGSMIPTLREGDRLLATKYIYHFRQPQRSEVVVFDAPETALRLQSQPYDPKQPVEYVKRVVGVPADHIRVKRDDGVYVNGEKLHEPYINDVPDYNFPLEPDGSISERISDRVVKKQLAPHIHDGALVVPEGYLFVLGDNRTESLDGHMWGLLERKRVIGKATYIFWPLDRKGLIR